MSNVEASSLSFGEISCSRTNVPLFLLFSLLTLAYLNLKVVTQVLL
jgi:hypothetical protein